MNLSSLIRTWPILVHMTHIDKDILENIDIDINIDKEILENIDIDKDILENIDIIIDIDKGVIEIPIK